MDGDLSQFPPPEDPNAGLIQPSVAQVAALTVALQRHNLPLRGVRRIGPVEAALIPLARRLGDDHASFRALLERAKASADGRHPCQKLNLHDAPGSLIAKVVPMARELERYGMLSRQHYLKSPTKMLQLWATAEPRVRAFLTGIWLEYYAYDLAQDAVRRQGQQHDAVFSSVQVTVPPGDAFDLDVCILRHGGAMVWIETKTGRRFNEMLPKYARVAQQLGLEPRRAILLCPDVTVADDSTVVTGAIAGMTITGLERFPTVLAQALSEPAGLA